MVLVIGIYPKQQQKIQNRQRGRAYRLYDRGLNPNRAASAQVIKQKVSTYRTAESQLVWTTTTPITWDKNKNNNNEEKKNNLNTASERERARVFLCTKFKFDNFFLFVRSFVWRRGREEEEEKKNERPLSNANELVCVCVPREFVSKRVVGF